MHFHQQRYNTILENNSTKTKQHGNSNQENNTRQNPQLQLPNLNKSNRSRSLLDFSLVHDSTPYFPLNISYKELLLSGGVTMEKVKQSLQNKKCKLCPFNLQDQSTTSSHSIHGFGIT
jgi:hypothetical protein